MIERLIEKITQFCNTIAAIWLLGLALVVLADVIGRGVFDAPLQGAKEILSNSVVAILFLQIPFAVLRGGMIRTTLIYDNAGQWGRRLIDAIAYLLGLGLFIGIGIGGWDDMVTGYQIGEYEGIGALEFQTWPIRVITVFWSFLAAIVYALLLFRTVVRGDQATSPPAQPAV